MRGRGTGVGDDGQRETERQCVQRTADHSASWLPPRYCSILQEIQIIGIRNLSIQISTLITQIFTATSIE